MQLTLHKKSNNLTKKDPTTLTKGTLIVPNFLCIYYYIINVCNEKKKRKEKKLNLNKDKKKNKI